MFLNPQRCFVKAKLEKHTFYKNKKGSLQCSLKEAEAGMLLCVYVHTPVAGKGSGLGGGEKTERN